PVGRRIRAVAEFLGSPSTHIPCGAGDSFPLINKNVGRFARHEEFAQRNRLFVHPDVFDERLFGHVVESARSRVTAEEYRDYNPQMVSDVVQRTSGDYAIAYLRTNHRGIQGHTEEFIVDIQVPDVAGDESAAASLSGDREVFWQNDIRLEELA